MRRYHVRFDDNVQEIESCCTYQSQYSHQIEYQNFKIDLNTVRKPQLSDPTADELTNQHKTVSISKANVFCSKESKKEENREYMTRLKRRKL